MAIGDTYRHHDPYEGESDIMIAEFLADGYVLVIHYNCIKYPGLKGQTEHKLKEDVERFYYKID